MNQNEFNVGVLALVDQIATTLSLSAHMPTRIHVRKNVREMLKDMPAECPMDPAACPRERLSISPVHAGAGRSGGSALELGTAMHTALEEAATTSKPFMGVISKWYWAGNHITGMCDYYSDKEKSQYNGIVAGRTMHTSYVHGIKHFGSFSICETANSVYVLLDEVK